MMVCVMAVTMFCEDIECPQNRRTDIFGRGHFAQGKILGHFDYAH
jgi:hypothetical protein